LGTYLYQELSNQVVGAFFAIHNEVGPGLFEKIYEEALIIELNARGIPVGRQQYFPVYYKEQLVGQYLADLVVSDKIIVEIKSVSSLKPVMENQLLNYMRISKKRVGYLANFKNEKVEFRRFVL